MVTKQWTLDIGYWALYIMTYDNDYKILTEYLTLYSAVVTEHYKQ